MHKQLKFAEKEQKLNFRGMSMELNEEILNLGKLPSFSETI